VKRPNFSSLFICCYLLCFGSLFAQEVTPEDGISVPDNKYKPLIVKLDASGKKYIRFISWHQVWLQNTDLKNNDFSFLLRRSRLLAYAQISDRFLILTHLGLNNLSAENMDPIGDARDSNTPQLFLHAAWNEFKVTGGEELYIGSGLHYWNGLSRLTGASTLNFMTLDNHRQSWSQLGLSDQFARHLGAYAKGMIGGFRYTLAVNNPISNALGSAELSELPEGSITYSGRRVTDDANLAVTGYFEWQLKDRESNKLPYRVGSYLGKKTVFNVGAGFFDHTNGTVRILDSLPVSTSVRHFAADVFYDAPLGKGALNAYGAFYRFDYGENFKLGPYGTGNVIYGHIGYVLPVETASGQKFMPYIGYSYQDYEAFDNAGDFLKIGGNWFINGHNAKITLEFNSTLNHYDDVKPKRVNGLILQTHIFL
jgi:hypothetical protein